MSTFKDKAPKDWGFDDTRAWLADFKSNYEDGTEFDFAPTLVSKGSQLVIMTKENFLIKSPLFGIDLYDNLQSLINNQQQPQHQPQQQVQFSIGNIEKREKNTVVGYDYPFVQRESFLKRISLVSYNNYQNRGVPNSQSHAFGLIAGGSGIGKTRAGLEVSTIPKEILQEASNNDLAFIAAMQDPIYLYINLSNGAGFHPVVDSVTVSPSIRVGIRVAYSSCIFKCTNNNNLITLNTLQSIVNTNQLDKFDLPTVLSTIFQQKQKQKQQQQQPIALIIHLDEYQLYIRDYCAGTSSSQEDGRGVFKMMLKAIGTYMMDDRDNFIIPVCTGTTERDLSFLKTEYDKVLFGLLPLDRYSCTPIIDYHSKLKGGDKIDKLREDDTNNFEICLADTGFIPKDISYFLESCISYAQYGIGCYEKIARLGLDQVSCEALETLCTLALTRSPVTLSTVLDSGTTVDDLRRKGLLYLIDIPQGFHIFLSFYNLKAYLRRIPTIVIPDHLLFFPSKDHSWKWQDFELLFPYYQRSLFNAFDRLEEGVTFSTIFRGAFGVDALPTGFISSIPTDVVYERESKFPGIVDGKVMVNGADITTTQSIFICSPNTEAIDQRWVVKIEDQTFIINSQTKHSSIDEDGDTKTISKPKILEMAKNFFTAMQSLTTPVIYMIVTNRHIDSSVLADFQALKDENKLKPLSPRRYRDPIVNIPAQNHYLIIISQANFETFFTPTFSHRGLMACKSSPVEDGDTNSDNSKNDESDVFYSSQPMDTSI